MLSKLMQPYFTDREAWNVFRLAAFAEALGWTLLITGILWQHFGLANGHDVLTVLGQTHGTLFFCYIVGLVAVGTSLRLSRLQFIIAAALSIPPYGTLVFEKYLAQKRRREAARHHREVVVRAIITDGKKMLVVQPKRGTFWCLIGGKVLAHESAESALLRHIKEQLGIEVTLGKLQQTQEYSHHGQARLELFYSVQAPQGSTYALTDRGRREYDELTLINPKRVADLRPDFLKLQS